jgi:hypothetical protein
MEFRTIDGSRNNLDQPELNAPGTAFARIGPARFADGISVPVEGPNPRTSATSSSARARRRRRTRRACRA